MQRSDPHRLFALAVALSAALTLATACGASSERALPDAPDGVLADLAGPEAMQVFALHPFPWEREDEGAPEFHGYTVLGSAGIEDEGTRDLLLGWIERGIEASDGIVAGCFDPRHGVEIVKNGTTTELLICFECLSMRVFRDGVSVPGHLTAGRYEPEVSAIFESLGLTIHGREDRIDRESGGDG